MDPQLLARTCAEIMWTRDSASRWLGMELVSVAPGTSVLTMEVSATMVNGHGICHGGLIFALADSAFAFACNSYNQRTVAQSCIITFLAPAKLGDLLTATGVEVSRIGRLGIYDITVARGDGDVVAEFRGQSRTIRGEIVSSSAP